MVVNNLVEVNEEKSLFHLFFLKDDEDLGVEVDEVKRIDFEMVVKRLKRGESVFIAPKKQQKQNLDQNMICVKNPWYFAKI
ncbi:MAG: hypothetical protein NWE80_01075 [Candidatus Bathyarchaeota archaeon]|nr:hypothetical protein [Candidatus Bathyarchaeota archaeon]